MRKHGGKVEDGERVLRKNTPFKKAPPIHSDQGWKGAMVLSYIQDVVHQMTGRLITALYTSTGPRASWPSRWARSPRARGQEGLPSC